MTPYAVLFTGAHVVAVALVGRCTWATVRRVAGLGGDGWEWPEHALFSLVGFVAFSCVLMVGNLVLGGAVFGVPVVAPLAALGIVGAALRYPDRLRAGRIPWRAIAVMVVALGIVYVTPALAGGSSVRTGDATWHLGWTEQLLHGEPVPTGPAPEFGRNAYPWGYHAVVATMTRVVPGSDALHGQDALHVLLAAAIPLAAACLARRVDRRAGWAGAGAAAFVGGFGWMAARGPEFATSPRAARFGADLTVASPNSVYELFPPAFPRELGLVLLGATAVALAVAGSRRARRSAGAVAGLAGLVSLPMFVAALLWVVLASLVAPGGERRRAFVDSVLPAVGVFALWAGPVASSYIRFGGFVDVTPRLGTEWPLPVALWSWGLLLPAAAAGLVVALRSGARVLLACTGGAVVLLALALLRGHFNWDLDGNATVLHQGRAWPPAHLLAAALAGVAVLRAGAWVAARRPRLAAAAGAVVIAVSAASPVVASVRLTEIVRRGEDGFFFGRAGVAPGSFVRRAAGHLDPGDVVDVEQSRLLAFLMFSFSGARIAAYDDRRLHGNDLRIRYADLARAWDERIAAGGFDPTWRIVPLGEVALGVEPAEIGHFGERDWALVRVPVNG